MVQVGASGAGVAVAGAGAGFGAAFFGRDLRAAAFFGALFFAAAFFFFFATTTFLPRFAFFVFDLDFFAFAFAFFAMIDLPIVWADNPNTHAGAAAIVGLSAGGTVPPVAQSISSIG